MEQRLAWLAGFIDADGSIGLSRPSTQGGYVGQLQIVGTDPRALAAIQEVYDALGVSYNVAHIKNDVRGLKLGRENHARGFNIVVCRFAALAIILPRILPYMVLKRDRAELVLEVALRRVIAMKSGRGANAQPYTDRDHEVFTLCRSLQTAYKEYANGPLN